MSQPDFLAQENARLRAENRALRDQIEQRARPVRDHAEALAALIEASSELIGMADLDGALRFVNPAVRRLFGLPAGDLPAGLTMWDFLPPAGRDQMRQAVMAAVLGRGSWQGELLLCYAPGGGGAIPIAADVFALTDPASGRPLALGLVGHDLTAREQSEAALRRERDSTAAILDSVGQGLTVTNAEGVFAYVNPAFAALIGRPAADLIGRMPRSVTVEADHAILEVARADRRAGLTSTYEVRLRDAAGGQRCVLVTAVPRVVEGRIEGAISVITDITDRKRLEAALARTTHLLHLHQHVASAANGAATLREAVEASMDLMLRTGSWELGHVYLPDPAQPEQLRSSGWWYGPLLAQMEPFRALTEAEPVARGRGLPGGVYASGEPRWLSDIGTAGSLPRANSARTLGIKTACAFPIRRAGQVAAVLEMFSRHAQPADAGLLEVMDNIGTQLGRVVERQEARQALQREQDFLQVVLNNIEDGIIACNHQGQVTLINRAMAGFHGLGDRWDLASLGPLDRDLYPIDGDDPLAREETPLMRAFRGEAVAELELRLAAERQPARTVVATGLPLRSDAGAQIGALVVLHDVTARKQFEQQREALLAQLRIALARTDALYQIARAVIGADPLAGQLKRIVEIAAASLRADRVAIITLDLERQAVSQFVCGGPGAGQIDRVDFAELMRGLTGWVVRTGTTAHSPGGQPDPRESAAVRQRRDATDCGAILVAPLNHHDSLLGTITAIHRADADDFTPADRELLEAIAHQTAGAIMHARLVHEVRQAAITDALTGAYNRRGWFALAGPLWEQRQRQGGAISVILFDADFFKRINDTGGHAAGDEVLRGLAARCKEILRSMDVFGRYGGEEFIVLLPDSDEEAAFLVAERLRRAIAERPFQTAAGPLAVTISLGLSGWRADLADLGQLVDRADAALYQAKLGGRNRTCRWQPEPLGEPACG